MKTEIKISISIVHALIKSFNLITIQTLCTTFRLGNNFYKFSACTSPGHSSTDWHLVWIPADHHSVFSYVLVEKNSVTTKSTI